MNTAAVAHPRQEVVPLKTGGDVAAIIPHSVEEMFRLATAIAGSGLAPKTLDTKEKVLVAIMAGAELGLAPHQAVQSFYVVNQRPTLWGDAIPALLWANGFKLREWYEGEGDHLVAKCEVTRPTGEVIPGEFSVEDAKKAKLTGKDGPWQTNPKRMLKMRARAFAARDGASDVLKGFQVREEVEDYQAREVKPAEGTGMRARLEGRGPAVGGFDPEHIETELAEVQDAEFHDPVTGEVVEAEGVSQIPASDDEANRDIAALGMKTGSQLLAEQEAQSGEPSGFPETTSQDKQSADQGGGSANNAPADGLADDFDPLDWAASFNRGLAQMQTVAEVADAWTRAKQSGLVAKLKAAHPGMAATVADAVNARVAEINGAGDE